MDDSETGRRAVAGLAALRSELSAIRALLAERDAQLAERRRTVQRPRTAELADRDAQLAEQDRRLAGQALKGWRAPSFGSEIIRHRRSGRGRLSLEPSTAKVRCPFQFGSWMPCATDLAVQVPEQVLRARGRAPCRSRRRRPAAAAAARCRNFRHCSHSSAVDGDREPFGSARRAPVGTRTA